MTFEMARKRKRVPKGGQAGFLAALGWLGVSGAVAYGAARLRDYALTSERFGLAALEVEGGEHTSREEVWARSGLELGQNLFGIDADQVANRLRSLSWVSEVEVRRVLPDRVRVELNEHRPVALVALGDLYYVSDRARVFRAYARGEPLTLPLIFGVSRSGYERADPEALRRLETALSFLTAWDEVFGSKIEQPRSVEVQAVGMVRYRSTEGADIRVGPPPWDRALGRAQTALDLMAETGRRVDALYVGRHERADRIVVRTRDAGVASATERFRHE